MHLREQWSQLRDDRLQRRINHDGFDVGNVVRENFVIGIDDRPAISVDRLFVTVFSAARAAYSSCLTICRLTSRNENALNNAVNARQTSAQRIRLFHFISQAAG